MIHRIMNIDPNKLTTNASVVANLLKQMSNANRLMILCALSEQEMSVSDLNSQIPLSQSALSQHLAKLRDASLVKTRRESQTIYYSIADEKLLNVMQVLYENYSRE